MSTGLSDSKDLHLPDLTIRGFRGIEQLSISRLGRVTLLAGKNGTGKTTLLDAVRVYAARGSWIVIESILRRHDEVSETTDEDGSRVELPNWDTIFHGRQTSPSGEISIGPAKNPLQIRLDREGSDPSVVGYLSEGHGDLALHVDYCGTTIDYYVGNRRNRKGAVGYRANPSLPSTIERQRVGPGVMRNWKIARLWDGVALTDDENTVVDALNLIFGDKVERVAVVGDDTRGASGRRPVVKTKASDRPVPLRSLGDGAMRMFGVALALANSRDGFLLIDEAENGIHHSVQRDFWKMVLKTAHENNVQVLATTHSWDCVAGYAMAATEIEEVDGALVRLERRPGGIRAVEYPEDDLDVIARQGIEVR